MHALTAERDLVIKVDQGPEYETHRLFYKGIQFAKLLWRPAVYYSSFNCDKCTLTECIVCAENSMNRPTTCGPSQLHTYWERYRWKLFQFATPNFQIIEYYRSLDLFIENCQIFHLQGGKWDGNQLTSYSVEITVLPDRMSVQVRSRDPYLFFADQPFHKEILDGLRRCSPFDKAPVWF